MSSNGFSRRTFLATLGVVGASAALSAVAPAKTRTASNRPEFRGMLVDTARCIGCRDCEVACAKAKGLPIPQLGMADLDAVRQTDISQLTVVNRFTTRNGFAFAKRQCMHCDEPACASICPTKAMLKTPEGPVIWRSEKCMGCRGCMISCPFDIPRFEYHSANPKVVKCDMCFDRQKQGKRPACVEACPAEALAFGTRRGLLEEGHRRISAKPDAYVHHIYGENEAGGTGVLYLSAAPFKTIGMNTSVEREPYPELTKPFLSAVPLILTLFPVFMLAASKSRGGDHHDGEVPR